MWKIVLLFVLLTPGILLTIPPSKINLFRGVKPVLVTACIHAVIFVVLMNWFSDEGFQDVIPLPPPPTLPSGNFSTTTIDKFNIANDLYLTLSSASQDYSEAVSIFNISMQTELRANAERATKGNVATDTKGKQITNGAFVSCGKFPVRSGYVSKIAKSGPGKFKISFGSTPTAKPTSTFLASECTLFPARQPPAPRPPPEPSVMDIPEGANQYNSRPPLGWKGYGSLLDREGLVISEGDTVTCTNGSLAPITGVVKPFDGSGIIFTTDGHDFTASNCTHGAW